MVRNNLELEEQLDQKTKESQFYQKLSENLSNRYLRDLEEVSKYSALLKEKVKIIDSQHQHLAKILDSVPANIYICDMDNHEVLFINAHMKKAFPQAAVGTACYQAFFNELIPCPDCISRKLATAEETADRVVTWEGKKPIDNKWYLNQERVIQWIDGRLVRIQIATDITARKESEQALRDRHLQFEQRYQTILETTQEGVCSVDNNFKIIYANNKMTELVGYSAEELPGSILCNLISPLDKEEHRHRIQARKQSHEAGLSDTYELRFRHKNGADLWMQVTTTALHNSQGKVDGSFVMLSDINEIKESYRQQKVNLERLVLAQAAGKIGSWEYDLTTGKMWISREGYAICQISPATDGEILIEKLLSCIPEITKLRSVPGKNQKFELEFSLTSQQHNEHIHLRSVARLITDVSGKTEKIIGIIQDITDRKQSELELRAMHAQLLHAEKLNAIGKLSASIAHEFNNPLQGILNIISGIREHSSLSPEDNELLDMAIVECNRMKSLTRSLHDFNRPTHTRLDLVDMQAMIDSLLLLNKKDLLQRGINLKKDYSPGLPQIKVIGDQMKQVILNLLQNAADACIAGDVITIALHAEAHKMILTISDTGCGIKDDDLAQIFNPFFTTKPDLKGTGLGLSISYGIVKKHGGRIDVVTKWGAGTSFQIVLPLDGEHHDQ